MLSASAKTSTFVESDPVDCGRLSDDGRFIAYTSSDARGFDVYVAPFPEGTPRIQVSTDRGWQPRWRKDGRELFYQSGRRRLMAVSLTLRPRLQASLPIELFGDDTARFSQYTVTNDGQRFLLVQPVATAREDTLTVIAHWNATLK